MAGPGRTTESLLDVVEVLVQAHREALELHGWAIAKAVKRSGPTVYAELDRLLAAGWITRRWVTPNRGAPRRRYYQLTGTGAPAARQVLADHRPERSRKSLPRMFVPNPHVAG